VPAVTMILVAILVNAAVAILTLCHARSRATRLTSTRSTVRASESARRSAAGTVRHLLFAAVYYSFLPIGHAQARLASAFQQTGLGLGWPLLVLWWPLRQAYRLGFRLCWALRP
jgi:hypothetical protein